MGPLGVNINGIIAEINKKTENYSGIRIGVKVIIDTTTKEFRIEVGSPPASAMILKELGIANGAKTKDEKVGDITLEQIKKIAKAKESKIYGKDAAQKVKQILGTCKSMGVTCEGKDPREVIKHIDDGTVKI